MRHSINSPGGREPGHVVRKLPQEGALPQKLVRPHGFGEGETAVLCPDVHDICVDLEYNMIGSGGASALGGGVALGTSRTRCWIIANNSIAFAFTVDPSKGVAMPSKDCRCCAPFNRYCCWWCYLSYTAVQRLQLCSWRRWYYTSSGLTSDAKQPPPEAGKDDMDSSSKE